MFTKKLKPETPDTEPDTIQALTDARGVMGNLLAEQQRLTQEILTRENLPGGNPAAPIASKEAAAVAAEIETAGGPPVPPFTEQPDIYHRREVVKAAIAKQAKTIGVLTTAASETIYRRDWQERDLASRKGLAAAAVALKKAFDADRALRQQMHAAGVTDAAQRPWLNTSNAPQVPAALRTMRLAAFLEANQNLLDE